MPACALAVHQLRYYLAFGSHASGRLAHEGHVYLAQATPFVVLLAAVGAGATVGALARTWQRHGQTRAVRVWALCALTLVAIYCAQELLEGMFAPGHPAGVAGILGHGGWIAIPAGAAVAAALALALRIAHALITCAARRPKRLRAVTDAAAPPRRRHVLALWRLEPLSGLLAGRAPPSVLSLT
jgi:hypothetical protein